MKILFEDIVWYPLKKQIRQADKLYAHTSEQIRTKERLEEHLQLTVYYLKKITLEKNLNSVLKCLYECLDVDEQLVPLFNELFCNVFYMHDVGKCNINFQLKKMENENFKEKCERDTNHALLSAAIYIEHFINRIKGIGLKGNSREKMHSFVLLNSFIISKHHGEIQGFEDYENKLEELYSLYKNNPEDQIFRLCSGFSLSCKIFKRLFEESKKQREQLNIEWQASYPYIYSKLVYSLLVSCDYYATSEYMEQEKIDALGNLVNIEKWQEAYERSDTFKAICEYKKQRDDKKTSLSNVKDINVLRSEMFLEATSQLECHEQDDLYFLEAPTGGGKTNMSIQLALKILKEQNKNKVFYVFPFNTLVEQTNKALKNSFQADSTCCNDITVINSITPIAKKQAREDERDNVYNRMLLDHQFLHYPWVITSHVHFFSLLFGTGKEESSALYQLVNSVIILDEVQSYKNAIWTEMISFLNAYAKILNFKIIIMSATLPQLGELLSESKKITPLICERGKYFEHPLFKNRVQLDFTLLSSDSPYETVMDKVIELANKPNKKILIEFIKKKTALKFFNDICERISENEVGKKIMLLTGDDSTWEREKCISYIKNENCKGVILVATQLIEAGVDIDMDYGLKDISLLDAEEQFLGRINRSCKKKDCWVYFFNLDSATLLYKGDCRKEKEVTLVNTKMQQILKDKEFYLYYREIFDALIAQNAAYDTHNLETFKSEGLAALRFNAVKKRMQLIDEDIYPYTVFLGIVVNIEIDNKPCELSGRKIWEQYTSLLKNKQMAYAEKKVRLSKLQPLMSNFMWKVKKIEVSYSEKIGDIFYIEEGEKYFENGKFSRELLCGSSFELI